MAKAGLININNRGILLAEYLKSIGKIKNIQCTPDSRVWLEFDEELTVTLKDYLEVHSLKSKTEMGPNVLRETYMNMIREEFRKYIQTEMVKTLKGGEVIEFIPGEKVTLRSTEKTEIICIRVTKEEKKKIEEEAEKLGLTISEYIRQKLLH